MNAPQEPNADRLGGVVTPSAANSRAAVASRLAAWTPRLKERRRRQLAGVILVAPAVTMTGVFFLVPLALDFWMSLHQWPLLGKTSWAGLDQYAALANDDTFKGTLGFTAIYTLIVVVLVLVIGFALGLLVNESHKGVGLFRMAFFLPVVVGFAPVSYLWLALLNPSIGLYDKILQDLTIISRPIDWRASSDVALAAVVVLTVWKFAGFSMLMIMNGLQSIPQDIQEAARVDGAAFWVMLTRISLPLLRRTIALVLVFSTVGSFLAFEPFYIITGGGPGHATTTLVFWVYQISFVRFQLGYGAAVSVVLLLILLGVTAFQMRLLRRSAEF